mmetsp:Transcript_37434/g.61591  ORF Transcript_37434/g.61591 Transcript_37434/m.61591 type:complete len:80 (+) Transcript_37434:3-242(+)
MRLGRLTRKRKRQNPKKDRENDPGKSLVRSLERSRVKSRETSPARSRETDRVIGIEAETGTEAAVVEKTVKGGVKIERS